MSAPDLTPPGWKPDPLSERLARIEGRFDTIDQRFGVVEARFKAVDAAFDSVIGRLSMLERLMLWGFGFNAMLSLAILARVLMK